MSTYLRQELINLIPIEKTDALFNDILYAIDKVENLNVGTIDEMLFLLNDPQIDKEVRKHIIEFFAWMNYKPSLPFIYKILASNKEQSDLKRVAMVYLSSIIPFKSFHILKSIILNDPEIINKVNSVNALAIRPSRRVSNFLFNFIRTTRNNYIKCQIIRAISPAPYNKKPLFAFLLSLLTDDSEDSIVRAYAAEGLGYLKDRYALKTLVSNLSNQAPEIRFMCAFSVGQMGGKKHVPLLEHFKDDEGFFEGWGAVGEEAKRAIQEIMSRI